MSDELNGQLKDTWQDEGGPVDDHVYDSDGRYLSQLDRIIERYVSIIDAEIEQHRDTLRAYINLDVEGSNFALIREEAARIATLCADRGQVINRGIELGSERSDFKNHEVLNGVPEKIQEYIVTQARDWLVKRYDAEKVYEPLEQILKENNLT